MPVDYYDTALRVAVARALRHFRTKAGYSQMNLRDKTQISIRHITNLERGDVNPGIEVIARFLAPLKADMAAFGREVDKLRKVTK